MKRRQQGAAIVLALVVTTLGVLLVSGMYFRQSVLIQGVENEASRTQARWLLTGAVDWVRVILREDARTSRMDHPGEAWATPLERTRLDNTEGDAAWLSGRIDDAQSRYNLRNLSSPAGVIPEEVAVLGRLLDLVGSGGSQAEEFALRVHAALNAVRSGTTVLLPATLADLPLDSPADRATLERLRPFVTLLPVPTPVNINTASAEVLSARFRNLSLADARSLVEARSRAYFRTTDEIRSRIPGLSPEGQDNQIDVATRFFSLEGVVEYRRARLPMRVLLYRSPDRVDTIWVREDPPAAATTAAPPPTTAGR